MSENQIHTIYLQPWFSKLKMRQIRAASHFLNWKKIPGKFPVLQRYFLSIGACIDLYTHLNKVLLFLPPVENLRSRLCTQE